MPHAAHHGSYINTLPKDLFKSSRTIDVWIPSPYETLEQNSSNTLVFKSGYIPFSTSCLDTQRKSILSRPKSMDVTLLLRQFLPSAEPSTYHVSESDIESAKNHA